MSAKRGFKREFQQPGNKGSTSGEYIDDKEDVVYWDKEALNKWIPPICDKALNIFTYVKEGESSLDDFCVCCWEDTDVKHSHPFISGGMCVSCKPRLLQTMFSKDQNDIHAFCTFCGVRCLNKQSVCSQDKCHRIYCGNCLNIWADGKLTKKKNWICFLCNSSDEADGDLNESEISLKVHVNWKQRVLALHEPSDILAQRALLWTERHFRVLSLFDGIGTGLLALQKLGIEVDVYYASEVLKEAVAVARTRLGPSVQHLGSVGEITKGILEDILPIDMVIGGSPCNDLSAVNRFPKDFYDPNGHSLYFFDFVRVRDLLLIDLSEKNGYRHLFWLFENVASMPGNYRERISWHLGCEPVSIDAKDFSAQHRRRFYWSNLPGIHSICVTADDDAGKTVDSILMPNSGRRATREKMRTATTNANSLLQGRKENCKSEKDLLNLFPVRFADKDDESDKQAESIADCDVLYIQEYEVGFGHGAHYTDVGNQSLTTRLKLLGHSWSVPVICSIFEPLKAYVHVKKQS